MRIIRLKNKYDSKIYVLDETKLIFKIDCLCGDFIHRRIKKVGECMDRKYYANPCKHLQPAIDALKKIGYVLKKPKQMEGPEKLTAEVRREVVARSGGVCEVEGCQNAATRFHRKVRGSNGGKYTVENTGHICKKHHDDFHASEFPGSKSK